ncbi:hypothetical protein ACLOJK_018491 [Asimina triloba]
MLEVVGLSRWTYADGMGWMMGVVMAIKIVISEKCVWCYRSGGGPQPAGRHNLAVMEVDKHDVDQLLLGVKSSRDFGRGGGSTSGLLHLQWGRV